MSTSALLDQLHLLDACAEARAWVSESRCDSIETAWNTCPDVTWMFWLLAMIHPGWDRISREIIERTYYPTLSDRERAEVVDLFAKYTSYEHREAIWSDKTGLSRTPKMSAVRRALSVRLDSLFNGGPDVAGAMLRRGGLSAGHQTELALVRELVPIEQITKYWDFVVRGLL